MDRKFSPAFINNMDTSGKPFLHLPNIAIKRPLTSPSSIYRNINNSGDIKIPKNLIKNHDLKSINTAVENSICSSPEPKFDLEPLINKNNILPINNRPLSPRDGTEITIHGLPIDMNTIIPIMYSDSDDDDDHSLKVKLKNLFPNDNILDSNIQTTDTQSIGDSVNLTLSSNGCQSLDLPSSNTFNKEKVLSPKFNSINGSGRSASSPKYKYPVQSIQQPKPFVEQISNSKLLETFSDNKQHTVKISKFNPKKLGIHKPIPIKTNSIQSPMLIDFSDISKPNAVTSSNKNPQIISPELLLNQSNSNNNSFEILSESQRESNNEEEHIELVDSFNNIIESPHISILENGPTINFEHKVIESSSLLEDILDFNDIKTTNFEIPAQSQSNKSNDFIATSEECSNKNPEGIFLDSFHKSNDQLFDQDLIKNSIDANVDQQFDSYIKLNQESYIEPVKIPSESQDNWPNSSIDIENVTDIGENSHISIDNETLQPIKNIQFIQRLSISNNEIQYPVSLNDIQDKHFRATLQNSVEKQTTEEQVHKELVLSRTRKSRKNETTTNETTNKRRTNKRKTDKRRTNKRRTK